MLKKLFKKRNENLEKVYTIWNDSVFEGKKRTEILYFKKKYRKIALARYNAKTIEEEQKADKEAIEAMNSIAKDKGQSNTKKILPMIIGGVLVATAVATNGATNAEIKDTATVDTPKSNAVVETIAGATENIVDTQEETIVEPTVDVEENNMSTVASVVTTTDVKEGAVVESKKEAVVESKKEAVVESKNNSVVVEDGFIYDWAYELGIERCQGTFDGIAATKTVAVETIIESSSDPIIKDFFVSLLDTNINHEVVKFDVYYVVPKGAVEFNSREGKFFADIEGSKVEAMVNFDLQALIDASIKAGVDEVTRDQLLSTLHNQTQVINALHKAELEFEKEQVISDKYLDVVKNAVANELSDITTWDVTGVIK